MEERNSAVDILLVEDNAGDARLVQEAFSESEFNSKLNIVRDGEEALAYLKKEGQYNGKVMPDLILLDLNMPKKDGRVVLDEIKRDPLLKHIPVIVLTTSESQQDISMSYKLHANCYVTKPIDLDHFMKVIEYIENYWFSIVKLPEK